MPAHDSPHLRRLRSDHAALSALQAESAIFRFRADWGIPPRRYDIELYGPGLERVDNAVVTRSTHRIEIKLGGAYPRILPDIRWSTPIFHPNISEQGLVCLGGFGTHWAAGIGLNDLCSLLWDFARMAHYDVRSPYNREAAVWVATQREFQFPLDSRTLRDSAANVAPPVGGVAFLD